MKNELYRIMVGLGILSALVVFFFLMFTSYALLTVVITLATLGLILFVAWIIGDGVVDWFKERNRER